MRGVKYGHLEEETRETALTSVRNGVMSLNAASRKYFVLKTRLKRHLVSKNYCTVKEKNS
jgi:hypothetical protein